jgi:aminoglycoside 6'-N-acetyltransferase
VPIHPGTEAVALADVTPGSFDLIDRWLGADHVRPYWGDPQENRRELSRPQEGRRLAFIVADGRKVGLIVWQRPTRRELDEAGLTDIPETAVDIDIMIGEADAQNRGAGRAAIRLVAEASLCDPAVPLVIAAIMVENRASRRAFAGAGFEEDREFDDVGYGRFVLMARRRAAGSLPGARAKKDRRILARPC